MPEYPWFGIDEEEHNRWDFVFVQIEDIKRDSAGDKGIDSDPEGMVVGRDRMSLRTFKGKCRIIFDYKTNDFVSKLRVYMSFDVTQ